MLLLRPGTGGRRSVRRRSRPVRMLGVSAGVVTALADASDMYVFTSPDRSDTVTVVANYYPFQAYNLPYHFATDTRYDMNIDGRGDGKPEITYRWTFRNEDNRGLLPAEAIGPVYSVKSANLRFRQHYTLENLQRGSAPRTLVQDGIAAPPHLGRVGVPVNVNTLVLQIPKAEVALRGDATRNPVIGVRATEPQTPPGKQFPYIPAPLHL
jgi:hypothetical protein